MLKKSKVMDQILNQKISKPDWIEESLLVGLVQHTTTTYLLHDDTIQVATVCHHSFSVEQNLSNDSNDHLPL